MNDRSTIRFQLTLVVGLLFAGGLLALTWQTTAPAEARDVPILVMSAPRSTTVTTATTTPTTVVVPSGGEPTTAFEVPRPPEPASVPRSSYAPEPIQEIGSMEIPKIGLRHTIYNGITMRNIDKGPSHWPGTALPGEVGNTVFAGHRTTKSKPFRNIDQLTVGDEVLFDVGGVRSTYLVTGSKIVLPTALEIVDPTATATGTLFACHPPGSAKFRYVVLLALADVTSASSPEVGS